MTNKIYDQEMSYSSVKQRNYLAITCLTTNELNNHVSSINNLKNESFHAKLKSESLHTNSYQEEQIYHKWTKCFKQSLTNEEADPFEHSIFKVSRKQLLLGLFILLVGIICHCATLYLLYRVYQNIVEQQVFSTFNKILVISVAICRVLRTLCSYYGDLKLNQVGLKIYRLVANAIVKKSLRCSPLTNKKISSTILSKIMHSDCELLLAYPTKIGFALQNVLTIILSSVLILYVSGLPGLVGILLLCSYISVRICFKKMITTVEKQINTISGQRIKSTIEMFNIIKLIKANTLESCFFNKLRQIRISEVVQLKVKLLYQMMQNCAILIVKPTVTAIIFKLISLKEDPFDIAVLFTVAQCVNVFNIQAALNAYTYLDMISISMRNIEEFMMQEEMDLSHLNYTDNRNAEYAIEITNGNFQWMVDHKQPCSQNTSFHLKNVDLKIKRGELVALVGGYGSGKSSLANCLLGEMTKNGNPKITVNGSIAYANQIPWIMNDTIKNNILFGKEYNQQSYRKAIKYASLESDLQLFADRDLTVIGKRGSTLSGGQKARVSFARALYSNADIYILDDILSAVDAHVGAFIFSMAIKKYLKNKTVLLITNSLYHVPHTDRVLIFEDGKITSSGRFEDVCKSSIFLNVRQAELRKSSDYELILSNVIHLEELKEQTSVERKEDLQQQISIFEAFKIYIKRNSGLRFSIIMTLFIVVIASIIGYTQINLNSWALSSTAQDNIHFYIQLLLNALKVVLGLLMTWVLYVSKIFQSIHDDMIKSLLFSPLSYFQKVPSDKIINRLSSHLSTNDKIITTEFGFMLVNLLLSLSYLFAIIYIYVFFQKIDHIMILIVFTLFITWIFSGIFSLSIKINKLERQLIIPINSKYSQMVDGFTTIRAYDKVQIIVNQFWSKVNAFSYASTIKSIIETRIKLIIVAAPNFLLVLQIFSLLYIDYSFKNYSIFLIYAFASFQDNLMRFYQSLAAFAPRLDSLGRCQQLTKLDPEKGFTGFLDKNWVDDEDFSKVYFQDKVFSKGEIVFENYSFRYKPQLNDVLKNLNFVVRAGEKIGIVGRTGSGKSSMMLGLLRIIEAASGKIMIDGIDISKLSLEQLRSNVNIILQEHFMFSGSVRDNVDPTRAHTDQEVENALKLCGVWQQFKSKQGLNAVITEGGDNLSAGQKQLLNISRSLLQPQQIVLIDEATASIDIKTDEIIQKVIYKHFANKTVLTIAHRINTVVGSDRILVLNQGVIAQFDTPQNLLRQQNSIFAKLYKQSGKAKEASCV